MNENKPKVFISYSHEDEEWKDLIRKYFDASELFDMWDDRDIELGDKWFDEIKKAITEADIAILLISIEFLNSSFIKNEEVPRLLNKDTSNIKIIPIVISSVFLENHKWLSQFQGYPKNLKPLDSFKVDNNIPFKKCPKTRNEINNFVKKIYGEYSSSYLNKEKFDNKVVVEENENELLDSTLDKEEQHKVDINNINIIKDNKKLGTITIKTVPVEVEGRILNVSIYPVTFEEYDLFCENNGIAKVDDEEWGRKSRPVINISWYNANLYCKWLEKLTDKSYRLPSVNEWKIIAKLNLPDGKLLDYISCKENTRKKTDIVGEKICGKKGIYSMPGNIYEWSNTKENNSIVVKGGSFRNKLDSFSLENSILVLPFDSNDNLGFRIVS